MRSRKNHNTLPERKRGKKKQPKSPNQTGGCIDGEDLISKLPDDILVCVLSRLTTQESVRCGTLSRRWAPLPKLVPVLRFGSMCAKYKLSYYHFPRDWELLEIEETKFIDRVNEVLDSYRAETLDELSISLELSMRHHTQIDKWVQFAMASNVRKLELDFSGYDEYQDDKYLFPPIHRDYKRLSLRDIGCTSLTDLLLVDVNVTGDHIEHFLKWCPLLESLCVKDSDSLTSLKIGDPVRLKFLEIRCCDKLKVFEVSAPNLVSFKYKSDLVTSMPLKCAPRLNEMSAEDGFYVFLINNFCSFTSYLSRIVTLSLDVQGRFEWLTGIPTLRNLKHLTISVWSSRKESLLCFTSWIEASPVLRRFVFKKSGAVSSYCKKEKIMTHRILYQHQHLQEVEFPGFIGDVPDTELVIYIIEKAINLDKIVFNCRYREIIGTLFKRMMKARRGQLPKFVLKRPDQSLCTL